MIILIIKSQVQLNGISKFNMLIQLNLISIILSTLVHSIQGITIGSSSDHHHNHHNHHHHESNQQQQQHETKLLPLKMRLKETRSRLEFNGGDHFLRPPLILQSNKHISDYFITNNHQQHHSDSNVRYENNSDTNDNNNKNNNLNIKLSNKSNVNSNIDINDRTVYYNDDNNSSELFKNHSNLTRSHSGHKRKRSDSIHRHRDRDRDRDHSSSSLSGYTSNHNGEMFIDKYDPSGYPKLTTLEPSFDDNIKRNITIPQGGTAFLQCKINHLGDRTVSWVRQKDLHILTSGRDTYTSDSRFRSINLPNSNEWTLEIRDTRLSDSGIYECQISTDPKMSTSVYLSVIALKTVISQGANLYLKKGANINLTCLINYIPDPGSNSFIIWQHSDQIINYDSRGRGAKLTNFQDSSKIMISNLLITGATSSDSGNYTCRLTSTSLPSHYAKPALIHVHVLNGGENPAAMQGGATSTSGHLQCSRYYPSGFIFLCILGGGNLNNFYISSLVPMLLTWLLIR